MMHALLADGLASHWRWTHITQGLLCWQSIHLDKSWSWWAYKSWYWDLVRNWDKTQKVVLKHLIEVHSKICVDNQTLLDKIFGKLAELDIFREGEGSALDFSVSVLDFLRLEWWASIKHGVENYSDSPVVDFIAMTTFSIQNLWCQIVWSSTDSSLSLTLEENLSSKSEITNLETHLLCEEKISEFQVSVNNLARVNVFESLAELVNVVASFNLMKSLASLDQVWERLVLANVKHDVDVLLVLEISVKANNVLIVKWSVDLNLTCQLLASFGSC